jgi:hypothetical protein
MPLQEKSDIGNRVLENFMVSFFKNQNLHGNFTDLKSVSEAAHENAQRHRQLSLPNN